MKEHPTRYSLMGMLAVNGGMVWQAHVGEEWWPSEYDHDYLSVGVSFSGHAGVRAATKIAAERLAAAKVDWLKPEGNPLGRWILDCDAVKREHDFLQECDWLSGRVFVKPEHSSKEDGFRLGGGGEFPSIPSWNTSIHFRYPTNESPWETMPTFPELQPYIEKFQIDHPQPAKCAFVMMRFADTPAHKAIFQAIRETCAKFGIEAVRADDKEYADELWPNIRTYMHGCGIGIVIFERLTQEEFNPNVSLEAGYMMAMGKPVCLLKDSTLRQLQTDLVGKLYRPINTQDAAASVPRALEAWLHEKGLVVK